MKAVFCPYCAWCPLLARAVNCIQKGHVFICIIIIIDERQGLRRRHAVVHRDKRRSDYCFH